MLITIKLPLINLNPRCIWLELAMELSRKFLVRPEKMTRKLKLKEWFDYDANKRKEDVEKDFTHFSSRMSELQYKLYADNTQSLLIILQGVDASGKDGTIRHVMGALNPLSCYAKSFKVPTTEELSHDYLWRVHMAVPSKGQIAIFNRSHYEDVIEVGVHNLIPRNELTLRYIQINDFERYLSENHITILKFFLHISKDEQKKRLMARLQDPAKRWKISESDLQNRKHWDNYMESYEKVLSMCSTKYAPWYIVPANLKWFRDWVVAHIVVETLDNMKLKYPQPKIDASKFSIE
ncbi:MAG TPA: PPK2 family polyphosphate kinase [Nitrososphaeraceae archaeon]|nr:PPK2 family polyphosphate kinase [Nitrososphaeraceae archaeon]